MQLKKYQAIDLLNRAKFELENVERLIASAGTFKNELNFNKAIVEAHYSARDAYNHIGKAIKEINK